MPSDCFEKLIAARRRLVTDAEVLQEILHRYVAIDRRDAIQPAFDAILAIVDEVFPVTRETADNARQMVLQYRRLSARDALHLAVMQQNHVAEILTFESGFDSLPGINRIG